MSSDSSYGLKPDDLVRPKKGRVQSNYFRLQNIEKARIIEINERMSYESYRKATIKLVKGTSSNEYHGLYGEGSNIDVYIDCLEKIQPPGSREPKYNVW